MGITRCDRGMEVDKDDTPSVWEAKWLEGKQKCLTYEPSRVKIKGGRKMLSKKRPWETQKKGGSRREMSGSPLLGFTNARNA